VAYPFDVCADLRGLIAIAAGLRAERGRMADGDGEQAGRDTQAISSRKRQSRGGRGLANDGRARLEERGESTARQERAAAKRGGAGGGGDANIWIPCADGKARRTQPGLQLLVDGVPFRLVDGTTREGASRVQALRGLGNAIVPPLAATFITAYLAATDADR